MLVELSGGDICPLKKNGRMRYYSAGFRKTDRPKPKPFEPALLGEVYDAEAVEG